MSRFVIAAALSIALPLFTAFTANAGDTMSMVTAAADLDWQPAQGLPPGASVAVLYGDPSKPGPFALRFKFPAGYTIPTHSHPTDELITFMSGKARMAFGEESSEGNAEVVTPDAFMVLPAGAWHALWIDAETIVELHSTGPFATTLLR